MSAGSERARANLRPALRPLRPDDVRGRFTRARTALYAGLILFWLALPFVPIAGRPAVLIDIPARRFFLFGAVLTASDVWLAVFLLAAFGLGLLFFTAWLGRVWCGFACPQTVFLEGVYRRIERLVEGKPRRDGAPPPLLRRVVKQALFLAVSLALAHVTLAYFVGAGRLFDLVRAGPAAEWELFTWAMAFTLLLELDMAWFREQTCLVCPYGRLQSALQDPDSLVVGYDARRGEPRGRRRAGEAAVGDCTDCGRCAKVCPAGIDIRNGLQLECIACAQCVDACDEVMTALKRPTGLIRFDSERAFAGEGKRVVRPRLLAYGGLFALAIVAVVVTQLGRDAGVEASLLRGQGAPYAIEQASVRNQLQLHLVNREPEGVDVTIEARAGAPAELLVAQPLVHLPPSGSVRVPIFVTSKAPAGFDITVTLLTPGQKPRELTAKFLGP